MGPNKVSGTSGWITPARVILIVAAFLAVMAAVFWMVSQSLDEDARRLEAEGQAAEARVTGKRIVDEVEVDRDGDRRRTTSHYLTVEFTAATGEQVVAETLVSATRYGAVREGDRVTVWHVPSDPQIFEFERGDKASDAGAFRWIALGMAVVAVGLGGVAYAVRRRG